MRLFYGFGIRIFYLIMRFAALFHEKANKWIAGRQKGLQGVEIPSNTKVIWFHCASLGEFDQGLPVMNALKEKDSTIFLVVTFFSPSGMEFYNKRKHAVDLALYLPLDTKTKATEFVAIIQPSTVFFVKYEFWYNHLKAAKRHGAKIYGVSSLFRPSHRFFKWYGGFFRKALRLFDHFYVQDEQSQRLLNSIGMNQVTVTGDTRYDRMISVTQSNEEAPKIKAFVGDKPTLILGSIWPVDLEKIAPALLLLSASWKIIIAPHSITEENIQLIADLFDGRITCYTTDEATSAPVFVLDTIGQLTAAYQYAQIAYVGGGFTGKLHNILEPGAFGVPVIFGPNFSRFPEAQLFLDRKAAISIDDAESFENAVNYFQQNQLLATTNLAALFAENAGAAEKVVAATWPA
jgi:3-deoxy-D-manno-octulosonic-acid transferase